MLLNAKGDTLEEIMNMVVVGGGPTGVELSGALAEMKKNVLPKDYPDMDFSKLKVYLLEGSPVTLGPMSQSIAAKITAIPGTAGGTRFGQRPLQSNTTGKRFDSKDGRSIKTRNLIWAAGCCRKCSGRNAQGDRTTGQPVEGRPL